jgi:thymidine phosphorylase
LGAGREKAGDLISYEVGMRLKKTIGDRVEAGLFIFFLC